MAGTKKVPAPPDNLDAIARCRTLELGSVLQTSHEEAFDGDSFNPGFGDGGRFHWFTIKGSKVPVLYAGQTRECALFETVFRRVPVATRKDAPCMLRGKELKDRALTEMTVAAPRGLQLVELHDPGLGKLGLRPEQLTATNSHHYIRTREWAAACHEQLSWAQGLIWMSARFNAHWAVILFGDRMRTGDLEAAPISFALHEEDGYRYVREVGETAGIDVTRPAWL